MEEAKVTQVEIDAARVTIINLFNFKIGKI